MFSRFYETELRWRRVAILKPVTVSGDLFTKNGGSQRLKVICKCHTGMRVLLRREPTIHERNAVSLFVSGERRIGTLSSEIADWVAPLVDSGKAAFDAEIWSLEESEHDQDVRICRLMLTQYERVTIKRLTFSAWWSGHGRSSPESPFRERRCNRAWALSPIVHLFSTSADIRNRPGND
jgi:HIRAN domain